MHFRQLLQLPLLLLRHHGILFHFLYCFVRYLAVALDPNIRIKFPPIRVASAEGSLVSSMEKVTSA
jgi:hypothetical protein